MPEVEILVSCEHAGHAVPAPYAALFADSASELASHRGWDPGALPVAERLAARLAAPLFFTPVSRLLIDNNRSLGHPALFSEISRALPRADKERIIDCYYLPHRQKVLAAVGAAIADGRQVLHLAIHSFTPVLAGQVRRADLGLLYDPARRHERQFCREWQTAIRKACPDLIVRRNYPYRGQSDGLATWLRGQLPQAQYLGVEVEINQARLLKASEQTAIADLLAQTLAPCLAMPLAGPNQPCSVSKLQHEQNSLPPGGGVGWGGGATSDAAGKSSQPANDPGDEIVVIVDADNRVVGQATRRQMRRQNLRHRATYILVFNHQGQLFVQKRTMRKDIYPGYFDIAAGGVVLSGESYEESARRELREELGVAAELELLFDRYFEDGRNRVWGRVYRCQHDGPFVLQESEVESGAFMTLAEIRAADKADFTPDGRAILEQLLSA